MVPQSKTNERKRNFGVTFTVPRSLGVSELSSKRHGGPNTRNEQSSLTGGPRIIGINRGHGTRT